MWIWQEWLTGSNSDWLINKDIFIILNNSKSAIIKFLLNNLIIDDDLSSLYRWFLSKCGGQAWCQYHYNWAISIMPPICVQLCIFYIQRYTCYLKPTTFLTLSSIAFIYEPSEETIFKVLTIAILIISQSYFGYHSVIILLFGRPS